MARVIAHMNDGSRVTLHPGMGQTPPEVVDKANQHSLTGSAVTMDNVWLHTADGALIRYGDVRRLETETE